MSSEPTELLRRLLEASANSPLAEADPTSLDELATRIPTLFNKRPMDTTYSEVVDMMRYYQNIDMIRAKRNLVADLGREYADKEPTKRGRKSKTTEPDFDSSDIGV